MPLKTKRKTAGTDVESNDENIAKFAGINTDTSGHKRAISEGREEEEESARKKQFEVKVEAKPKKESNEEEVKEDSKGRNRRGGSRGCHLSFYKVFEPV